MRADMRKMGDFNRVHPMPGSSADVADDLDARLVVLGLPHTYSKQADNAAETWAKGISRRAATLHAFTETRLSFLRRIRRGCRIYTRLRESS